MPVPRPYLRTVPLMPPISRLTRAAALSLGLAPTVAHSTDLTIASWGGDYADAQKTAFVEPWMAARGKTASMTTFDGAVASLRREVEQGTIQWDVVDLERADARMLCDLGLLEPIDPATLPGSPDGAAAADDFVPGALEPCAIAHAVWSTVIAYDRGLFPGGVAELDLERTAPADLRAALGREMGVGLSTLSIVEVYALASAHIQVSGSRAPQTIADFFDLERFPGPRGMRQTPEGNLELALLADGVAPGEVYGALATEEGVRRAFAKLDQIRPQVVWWRAGVEPPSMLAEKRVAMTTAYHRGLAPDAPVGVIPEARILRFNMLAAPKGAPNRLAALDFLGFATGVERQAAQVPITGYGPSRRSAGALAAEAGGAPNSPTAPAALAGALSHDVGFWTENRAALNQRFGDWLSR